MNTIRAEWTKLRSVRSTWIMAVSTVSASAALSMLGAYDFVGTSPSDLRSDWDPTAVSLKGFLFAQLLIGMLGALSVTPEHATGMIGTSLAAVPSRFRLLGAKLAVVAALALATSIATTVVSFTAVRLMLGGDGLPLPDATDPRVLGALCGATAYLALIALAGVAIGALTRSTAASLAVLVGALLLAPALAPGLPGAIGDRFERYWPSTAGQAAYTVVPLDGSVGPGQGLMILVGATAATVVAAYAVFRVREV